jgi:hypothetical protein
MKSRDKIQVNVSERVFTRSILIIISFYILTCPAEEFAGDFFRGSVITDPAITRKCEELIALRAKKISYKNRILELISKNKKLNKMVPQNRQKIAFALKKNLSKLHKELKLARMKIERAGEKIILKGCPGISL